jgi:uncharacterized membrane protein YphA (DoxX/SURF4 family)
VHDVERCAGAEGVAAVIRRALVAALRLGLGGLFVFAGAMKLRDPGRFALEISNYHLASALAPHLAIALPGIEVAAGLAVLLAPAAWRRSGALVVAALMLVFTAAVTSVLARGINVDCGCFGGGEGPVTAATVVRDVVLLAAAIALVVMDGAARARPALPPTTQLR